jgi:tRNA-dihydrouridine synthase 3
MRERSNLVWLCLRACNLNHGRALPALDTFICHGRSNSHRPRPGAPGRVSTDQIRVRGWVRGRGVLKPGVRRFRISRTEVMSAMEAAAAVTETEVPREDKPLEDAGKGKGKRRESRRSQRRKGHAGEDIGLGVWSHRQMLCGSVMGDGECRQKRNPKFRCERIHDLDEFFAQRPAPIEEACPMYEQYGVCPAKLNCRFGSCIDVEKRVSRVKPEAERKPLPRPMNVLPQHVKHLLRKDLYEFAAPLSGPTTTPAAVTESSAKRSKVDTDHVSAISMLSGAESSATAYIESHPTERERWASVEAFREKIKNATYVAPLTTVGNLPFRRLLKTLGVDITCSEMAVAHEILREGSNDVTLLQRHPDEDFYGCQLAGGNPRVLSRTCELLEREGREFDFVDLNMGCPLDMVCKRGMGAQTMYCGSKFETIMRAMSSATSRPVTLKMRTGAAQSSLVADKLAERARRSWCIAAVSLHGRTRLQRYSKSADWDYIAKVARESSLPLVGAPLGGAAMLGAGGVMTSDVVARAAASSSSGGSSAPLTGDGESFEVEIPPLPIIGNGDVMDPSDFYSHIADTGVTTCLLARGILIKPWLGKEIKEAKVWDISAHERLEIYRKFCRFGLEHWGSDQLGVDRTRRFLLEMLSFTHRYVPYGLLEHPPQRMNLRPEAFRGRDDLETLLSSGNEADWVRISEMFLGPVREGFLFVPKHKANSYGSGSTVAASSVVVDPSAYSLQSAEEAAASSGVVEEWG